MVEVQDIINNISEAPDFALISNDKTKIYLVEVKYQHELRPDLLRAYANKLLGRWKYPWLFVATPKDFYCSLCKDVLSKGIDYLPETWVIKPRQKDYLDLLNEFEK